MALGAGLSHRYHTRVLVVGRNGGVMFVLLSYIYKNECCRRTGFRLYMRVLYISRL
jgi:hypothetical protein